MDFDRDFFYYATYVFMYVCILDQRFNRLSGVKKSRATTHLVLYRLQNSLRELHVSRVIVSRSIQLDPGQNVHRTLSDGPDSLVLQSQGRVKHQRGRRTPHYIQVLQEMNRRGAGKTVGKCYKVFLFLSRVD